ncbi:unnamed protein product, partial [Symbiodinium pilosum]
MSWSGDGSAWHYWRGAPTAWTQAATGGLQCGSLEIFGISHGAREQEQGQDGALPAFDQTKPASDQRVIMEMSSSSASGVDPLISQLQRAVNMEKKAEKRVQAIEKEQLEKKQQWSSWQAQLKQSYAKEKTRFLASMERLARDLCRGYSGAVASQDLEFAALIHSADLQMEERDDMEAVIQRAKQAALQEQRGTREDFVSTPLDSAKKEDRCGQGLAALGLGQEAHTDG